jgi:hypothetical protein
VELQDEYEGATMPNSRGYGRQNRDSWVLTILNSCEPVAGYSRNLQACAHTVTAISLLPERLRVTPFRLMMGASRRSCRNARRE